MTLAQDASATGLPAKSLPNSMHHDDNEIAQTSNLMVLFELP
jgi:hypothetical protein